MKIRVSKGGSQLSGWQIAQSRGCFCDFVQFANQKTWNHLLTPEFYEWKKETWLNHVSFHTCARRFELPTPWSVAKCSIQLSYAHIFNSLYLVSDTMPATGIEPVLYFYNRILSPARLPIPPRRHNEINSSNGTYRARTYDPLLVRQMLSQLS